MAALIAAATTTGRRVPAGTQAALAALRHIRLAEPAELPGLDTPGTIAGMTPASASSDR